MDSITTDIHIKKLPLIQVVGEVTKIKDNKSDNSLKKTYRKRQSKSDLGIFQNMLDEAMERLT